jgi:3-dehydroshikimate dehydratase
MKVGLCTVAFRERLLEDAVSIAEQIGFDGVEIWGREPHISETFDEGRVRAARKMIEGRGLQVCGLASYLRFGGCLPADEEEEAPDLASVLHTARVLGAPVVRVWAGGCPPSQDSKADWDLCVDELRVACEKAENLGVALAVEMQPGTFAETAESANRLLDEVGAPNLRLNYQPGNGLPPEDPVKRLRAVLPRIVSFRVRNYDQLLTRAEDRNHVVPLAEGVFDYRELIGLLRNEGFSGYLTVECVTTKAADKVNALRADVDFLRSLLPQ